jgi:hypothetical protein
MTDQTKLHASFGFPRLFFIYFIVRLEGARGKVQDNPSRVMAGPVLRLSGSAKVVAAICDAQLGAVIPGQRAALSPESITPDRAYRVPLVV